MIEVSSLKLSQFLLRSTVSDGISRSVQISNRIFLSLSIATVVTPLVLSPGRQGLQTQFVVQAAAMRPLPRVCRQQPLSRQNLIRVWKQLERRAIARTIVQQLGANQLICVGCGAVNSITRSRLLSSSNLYPVQRLLNQLPLKQESGA